MAIKPDINKQSRLLAVSSLFEMGQIILPADKPWLADYIKELLSFPKARHDDMVDSTSQALNYMRKQADFNPRIRLF